MKTRRRDPLGRKNNYPLWARCCLLKRQNALVGGASRRSGSIPARFTAGYLLRWLASNPLYPSSVPSLGCWRWIWIFGMVQGWWKRFFWKSLIYRDLYESGLMRFVVDEMFLCLKKLCFCWKFSRKFFLENLVWIGLMRFVELIGVGISSLEVGFWIRCFFV